MGAISGSGTITGNDIAARYAVTPTSVDFGTVYTNAETTTVNGQSVLNVPKTVTLENNTDDSAAFTHAESSDFYLDYTSTNIFTDSYLSRSFVVYPKASVLDTAGSHSGSVSFTNGGQTYSATLAINVGSYMDQFVFSTDTVDFGAVTKANGEFSPSSKSITVTNNSDESAVIRASSGDYFTTSVSSDDGATVAAGETYTIYFYINSTASVGSHSETIYFSCGEDDSAYAVSVSAVISNQEAPLPTPTGGGSGGTTKSDPPATTEKEALRQIEGKPNTTVNVDFTDSEDKTITKKMLEAAKKNNVNLVIMLNSRLTIEISSKDIVDPKDLDLNALFSDTVLSNIINSENMKSDLPTIIGVAKPGETITTYMDIPFSGVLGVTVTFKVKMLSTVRNGKYANIFKLVESADEKDTLKTTSAANDDIISFIQMLAEKKSKTVKPKKSVEIIDWNAIFNLDSASEYIIVVTDKPLITADGALVNGRLSDLTVGEGTTGCEEQLG